MANKFINYRKLTELREASKNGNDKAKVILDKYMQPSPDMESIDRLLDEYYGSSSIETLEKVEQKPLPEVGEPIAPESVEEEAEAEAGAIMDEAIGEVDPTAESGMPEYVEQPLDISADLDRELDGLIDVDEISAYSFRDYLGDKRKNANRARKDAAYFKAFDQGGRESYIAKKEDEFSKGLQGKIHDADRSFRDIDMAIDGYGKMVTDLPDDEAEIDVATASKAYDEFTENEDAMGAFGRSWDNEDNEAIKAVLSDLVSRYGKKNVMAALNTLKDDNKAYHDESKGKIEASISKYGKSLESLLK